MGLFDATEVDWENEVEEYQTGIPAGNYEAIISHIGTEEKETGTYLVITYTVTDENSPYKGKTHREFQRIVAGRPQNQADEISVRSIKTRLVGFGVAPDAINTFEPDDVVGTEVLLRLVNQKNDPRYRNVISAQAIKAGGPTLPKSNGTTATTKPTASADNPFG